MFESLSAVQPRRPASWTCDRSASWRAPRNMEIIAVASRSRSRASSGSLRTGVLSIFFGTSGPASIQLPMLFATNCLVSCGTAQHLRDIVSIATIRRVCVH